MTDTFEHITVLDNRVLVKVIANKIQTKAEEDLELYRKAGLAIPPEVKKRVEEEKKREHVGTQFAEIVAIGSRAFEEIPKSHPTIGDTVMFQRYKGLEVEHGDNAESWYRIIFDTDIECIYRKS